MRCKKEHGKKIKQRAVLTVYDVLQNRCGYAAIHLLLEQAHMRSDPLRSEEAEDFWRHANKSEYDVAVTLFEQSMNKAEAKVRYMKLSLGFIRQDLLLEANRKLQKRPSSEGCRRR